MDVLQNPGLNPRRQLPVLHSPPPQQPRAKRLKGRAAASEAPPLRSWTKARELAEKIEAKLTVAERFDLIHGQGMNKQGKWVGYIFGPERLGIPDLKLQDASSGFRPTNDPHEYGTVTQWPSLLSLAATWDEELLGEVAAALAREFKGKGANVLLGPGLNTHRTPFGGRNWEYLPGEAPYLGAHLVRAYIEGVQGEGVMAVMKHFAFNEQETDRSTSNSVVDERTAWEVYYPPFEAAVEAGVGATMCSYNKVNGTFACHSKKVLHQDLKGTMGFQGFVMSDWGAVHSSAAVLGGSDMEMPDGDYFNAKGLDMSSKSDEGKAVREAACRVLTSIYHLGLDEQPYCTGACWKERNSNQRTQDHADLATKAAIDGVVLLKNNGVLPLRNVKKLAVMGQAADAKDTLNIWGAGSPYSGGGSGHVASTHVVTALQGIKARAERANITVLSGIKTAKDLLAEDHVDVAIVVGSATATESKDRKGLSLDWHADALITDVANTSIPTVVLLEIPGAVTIPWRDKAAAVACLFNAGEATGTAWASVLFGDAHPSGRLPIAMPTSEDGLVRPGSDDKDIMYNETASKDVVDAFPFGHGLSYTGFDFSEPWLYAQEFCEGVLCFGINITNVGLTHGRDTVQVYIQFDSVVPEKPKYELRTFQKTRELESFGSEMLFFSLSKRELSRWNTVEGDWRLEPRFHVHVGASSLDIRRFFHVDLSYTEPPSPPRSYFAQGLPARSECGPRLRPLHFLVLAVSMGLASL
jgi:beta-glucosidase